MGGPGAQGAAVAGGGGGGPAGPLPLPLPVELLLDSSILGNATAASDGNNLFDGAAAAAAEAAAPGTLDLESIFNATAAAADPAGGGGGGGGGSPKWQAGLLSVLISVAVIFTVVSGEWEGGPWKAWGRAARTDCKRAVPFQ